MIALALAAVFMLSAAASRCLPQQSAQENAALEQQNDMVSSGSKPRATLFMAPTTSGGADQPCRYPVYRCCGGCWRRSEWLCDVVLSDKIRTLLKMIRCQEDVQDTGSGRGVHVYSYLKQLIDGNDVSVLLGGDEAVSVMDVLHFYVPTIDQVSNGLPCVNLIRKYCRRARSAAFIWTSSRWMPATMWPCTGAGKQRYEHRSFAMFKIKPRQTACACTGHSRPKSLTAKSCRASMKRLCWKWMVRWCPPIRSATATRSPAGQ